MMVTGSVLRKGPILLRVVLVVVAAVALVGCGPSDKFSSPVVPAVWGSSLVPDYFDVGYAPDHYSGCGPGAESHAGCDGSQTLDIYRAVDGEPQGTLVFVHGGGFVGGDKFPMGGMGLVRSLVDSGWSVVSVNYRLSSSAEFLYPAAATDVVSALRWVSENGSLFGLNVSRLVVAGHSAGGTLAIMAGTVGNSGFSEFGAVPPLSGWVSFGGISDFGSGPSSEYFGRLWIGNERFDVLRSEASPVTWWDAADSQGYVAHGDLDDVVEYTNFERFVAVAGQSGRVVFDSVDYWEDGSSKPVDVRGHNPTGGINSLDFVGWLNGLPAVTGA